MWESSSAKYKGPKGLYVGFPELKRPKLFLFKAKILILVQLYNRINQIHLIGFELNKARYTATEVTCGWAGAIFEVTRPFGQEQ